MFGGGCRFCLSLIFFILHILKPLHVVFEDFLLCCPIAVVRHFPADDDMKVQKATRALHFIKNKIRRIQWANLHKVAFESLCLMYNKTIFFSHEQKLTGCEFFREFSVRSDIWKISSNISPRKHICRQVRWFKASNGNPQEKRTSSKKTREQFEVW